MSARLPGRATLALLVMVVLPREAEAAGATKAECIAAFDRGQVARSAAKYHQARADLLVCTQESCPAVLRADCSGVLQSVEAALPTVVFAADDGAGHDLTDVRVSSGTHVVAEAIDGKAVEIDPGTYDFRFEAAGAPPVTVHRVVKEGEKSTPVRASFPSLAPKPRSPRETASVRPRVEEPRRSVAGWIVPIGLGVVGLGALGFAGASRLRFDSDVDDLRARCAPGCTQAQRADLSTTLVTANVSLGVGIGALALAAVSWFVFRPSSRPTSPPSAGSLWPQGGTRRAAAPPFTLAW